MVKAKLGSVKIPKTEEEIISSLHQCNGLLYPASKLLGIARQSLEERVKSNPKLHRIWEGLLEVRLDIAEQKLMDLIEGKKEDKGDSTSIMFFLKTRGKHRGYGQGELTKENLSAIKVFLDMQREGIS